MKNRTKAERRLYTKKVKDKAKNRAKNWSTPKWWVALEISTPIDSPTIVNGNIVENCGCCRDIGKFGKHSMMERSTERKFAIDFEINAA